MFANYEKMIDLTKGAIIVWDVQEALVSRIFNREEFVSNLQKIIKSGREKGVPILYTRITPLPEKFESPLRKNSGMSRFEPGDIIKEVYPIEGEMVINKNTASIFVGTNFELLARNYGITTLFLTGIATEMGIETTARHSLALGILPVIIADAVSSMDKEAHERSLLNMGKLMPVLKTENFLKMLK